MQLRCFTAGRTHGPCILLLLAGYIPSQGARSSQVVCSKVKKCHTMGGASRVGVLFLHRMRHQAWPYRMKTTFA